MHPPLLRLVTANLLGDRLDADHLAEVLDRTRPDVLVIQELSHDAARVIADRFDHLHLRPSADHRGRGIASKIASRFGEIPLVWRPGLWCRLEEPARDLVIANVHIRNPMSFPWWRSERFRREQLRGIFEWADHTPADAMVVAGDMNASPAWPVYRRLSERWDDLVAGLSLESGARAASTWAWRPGWPRLLRIDHIFGTGVRAVASEVIPVRGTDHAAVVVDLTFD